MRQMLKDLYDMLVPPERQSIRKAMRYWVHGDNPTFTTYENGRITR